MKKTRKKKDVIELKPVSNADLVWAQPMSLKTLCVIWKLDYNKSRNRIARRLKSGKILNKRFSRTEWRVHITELPIEYVIGLIVDEFARAFAGYFVQQFMLQGRLENANIDQI